MTECLYVGEVRHHRHRPKTNSFRYGVYFAYLDIERIDEVASSLRLLSHNRPGLFSIHDRDHGPRDGSALRPWIDSVLRDAGIELGGGPVHLLAFPRALGFKFYPVSFWYCHHADGTLRAVLAEVQNTFGGHHNYLLHDGGAPMSPTLVPEARKAFYVSPFIEMDGRYEFRLSDPGDTLAVSIHDFIMGPLLLTASVQLHARPLTDRELLRVLARYGPMSARAWILIHLQAIKIVAKGIRYVPPPKKTDAAEEAPA